MIEEYEIISIEKIKLRTKKSLEMFDLETEKNHNFFANGFLVHNSGTAFREDGNDMKITATCGYIIEKLKAEELIDNGWLMKPTIIFIKDYMTKEQLNKIVQSTKTGKINETEKYPVMYKALISENDIRNNVIKEIVESRKGDKILIVTKLVEHGKILAELTGGAHLYGDTNKTIREQMFDDFVSGKNNVLISTISIFSEGIDIKNLEVVINAAANKGDVKSIQLLGRGLRKCEGKEKFEYIDFIDETRFFKLGSYGRKTIFGKEGHDRKVITWEEFKNVKNTD